MRLKKNLRKWAVVYGFLMLEFGVMAGAYVMSERTVQASATPPATFSSAEAAGNALYEGAKSKDRAALLKILGPEAEELISEGDASADAAKRAAFAAKYEEMHRFTKRNDGKLELIVGAENWPLPIPLAKKDGSWSFDIVAGEDEVLYRRIGKNEMAAIFACGELEEAQRQYFADGKVAEYAASIAGDPEKHDGLFTKGAGGGTATDGDANAPLF